MAIAGVAGNGQQALAELLFGLHALSSGAWNCRARAMPARARAWVDAGVARIPEDRHAVGVVGDLPVWENAMLERYATPVFSRLGVVKRAAAQAHAQQLIERFDVRGTDAQGLETPTRALSGGNMQKLILGRALVGDPSSDKPPTLIVADQPTWGLDIGAVAYVHQQLLDACAQGAAVLLISEDLDEIFAIADRVAVLHQGHLSEARPTADWTLADIGLAMSGAAAAADARRCSGGSAGPMRIEKRALPSRRMQLAAPLLAIAFTLAVSSLLVAWAGAPVGRAYALLLEGGFGSTFAWSETLTRATPLILTGLSAAVAFRARLFNIGAEGQLYAGALAAVAIGGLHGGAGFALPAWLLFPLMMAAAALAGALLLLGPALLKSRLGVDEVVTTLLLNFIVLLFVSMMLDGADEGPDRDGLAAERGAAGRAAAGQADRTHARAQRAAVGAGAGRGAVGADEVQHARLRDPRRRRECARRGLCRHAGGAGSR